MQTIHKHHLNPNTLQEIRLPINSEILSVKNQREQIVLYAAVTNETEYEDYDILILGTGHRTNEVISKYTFLCTVNLDDGGFMLHVFYRKSEAK